jgi:hypothetical protein
VRGTCVRVAWCVGDWLGPRAFVVRRGSLTAKSFCLSCAFNKAHDNIFCRVLAHDKQFFYNFVKIEIVK